MVIPTRLLLQLIASIVQFDQVDGVNTLTRCFRRITGRNIDNYKPLAEYNTESVINCGNYCIMAVGEKNEKEFCRSFTYNVPLKSCRLYDNDGMKIPAILHPAITIDLYKRISAENICKNSAIFELNEGNETNRRSFQAERENPLQVLHSPLNIGENARRLKNEEKHLQLAMATNNDKEKHLIRNSTDLPLVHQADSKGTDYEACATSTGYYVVIGNEIVQPIKNGGTVEVFNDVDQGDCANFCSMNQGPNHKDIVCHSLNYFPLTRKCELYSILAEPHGLGNLVENENVIFAEKFCLPDAKQSCQSDEVFILHIQRSLSIPPNGQISSQSITDCLKSCLNSYSCKTMVFASKEQRCRLYSVSVSESQDSIIETNSNFVMIENGCAESGRKMNPEEKTTTPKMISDDSLSSDWSDCNFRINGIQVKVRTTKSGAIETMRCDDD